MVNTAGFAVTTKSGALVMEMVYFSATAATFVTVLATYTVLTKLANVMEGILRSVGLPASRGHDILVAPRTSRGVDKEHKNLT